MSAVLHSFHRWGKAGMGACFWWSTHSSMLVPLAPTPALPQRGREEQRP